MEIEIIKSEKEELELKIDNITVAEILRVYLNDVDGVGFAAWRREHPSKPVVMRIHCSGKTAKKAVSDAVSAIKKDLDGFLKVMKK